MKKWLVVLAVVAAPNVVVSAELITKPEWLSKPKGDDMAGVYPPEAQRTAQGGTATIQCEVAEGGVLAACTIVTEAPFNMGFGKAALALAPKFRMATKTPTGQSTIGGSVKIPITFRIAGGDAQSPAEWLKQPSQDDIRRAWPAAAQKAGVKNGKATIQCHVATDGLLQRCRVADEQPKGLGFGAAALTLAPGYAMRMVPIQGVVTGGDVRIPIQFNADGAPAEPSPGPYIAKTVPWAETPTVTQHAQAFPQAARGKVEAGHVLLRCIVQPAGTLAGCDPLSEEPKGLGFAPAALTLAKLFKASVDFSAPLPANTYVDLPIDFRSLDKPEPASVSHPVWTRTASPAYTSQVFPAKARQAGLVSGRGVVTCEITHEGRLTACSLVREEPAGLGFGDAALTITSVMAMNPWTNEGRPVDGARIQVAIRLDLPAEQPAPAPPAP